MGEVRTRFAPSPTGYMHIGNLRTALYSYLIAKKENGTFLLRIEDTDTKREVSGAEDYIYKVLKKTHLNYDEGPYKQSLRLKIYQNYAHQLVELGGAHYCFCDESTLQNKREENESYTYQDPCRNLSLEEAKKRIENGEPYTIRQTIPDTGKSVFNDEVYGHIEIENQLLDEGILIKSDGYPTYNFANVIDDHLMGITHVVRGNEYLSSTPKYNLIYQAFGWDLPHYVHVPSVMKDETHKLSKRNGDASFDELISEGYLPEAIINYMALLGWAPEDGQEIFTLDQLIEAFSIERISKSPAIFDKDKLTWMNGMYLRQMSINDFHQLALPYYQHYLTRQVDQEELSLVLQPRIEKLGDIKEMIDFLNEPYPVDLELYTHKKMKTNLEISLQALIYVREELMNVTPFDDEHLLTTFKDIAKDHQMKNGQIMRPIRVALSYKPFTPGGAVEMVHILGLEESLDRIDQAIQDIKKALRN